MSLDNFCNSLNDLLFFSTFQANCPLSSIQIKSFFCTPFCNILFATTASAALTEINLVSDPLTESIFAIDSLDASVILLFAIAVTSKNPSKSNLSYEVFALLSLEPTALYLYRSPIPITSPTATSLGVAFTVIVKPLVFVSTLSII